MQTIVFVSSDLYKKLLQTVWQSILLRIQFILLSFILFYPNKMLVSIFTRDRGTWAAQSAKRLTLCFGSGHDLRIMRSSPTSGSALALSVSLLEILSLPLPLPFPQLVCSLNK